MTVRFFYCREDCGFLWPALAWLLQPGEVRVLLAWLHWTVGVAWRKA